MRLRHRRQARYTYERADAGEAQGAVILTHVAPPGRGCGRQRGIALDDQREVVKVLEETLNLPGMRLTATSPLLGAVPELDSMAVVSVITTLEERFGFTVADDEIDGSIFATVGSLIDFVKSKLAA
jgi:acyl carrier protein